MINSRRPFMMYDNSVDEKWIHPTDPTEKYLLKWYKNNCSQFLLLWGIMITTI